MHENFVNKDVLRAGPCQQHEQTLNARLHQDHPHTVTHNKQAHVINCYYTW